tara:strand:+ start:2963 stop:3565 length:603 start_codon:yes stop_codon:yes gene_type:complete
MGSEAASKSREQKRTANTQELMSNIMSPGAGEISKKREAELQKAANAGRGVQFIPGSPTVGNLYDKDGKPILRTNATAADYTGRITANAPTFREAVGDAGRAIFGGKAKDPEYLRGELQSAPGKKTTNYAKFLPKTEKVKGLIPTMAEAGGTPFMIAMNAITGNKKDKPMSMNEKYNKGVTTYANLLSGSATKNRNKLIR